MFLRQTYPSPRLSWFQAKQGFFLSYGNPAKHIFHAIILYPLSRLLRQTDFRFQGMQWIFIHPQINQLSCFPVAIQPQIGHLLLYMAVRRKAACDLFQGNHPHRILKDLRQLLSDDQALRQRIDTIHRHPFFRQFACLLRTLSIDPLKIRKNERRIGDFADSHPTAIGRRTPQIILGDYIIIELRLHQHSPRFMKGHGAAAAPLCLRMIQDRRIRLMDSIR